MDEETLKSALVFFQSDRTSYGEFRKGRKPDYLRKSDRSYSQFFRDFLLPNFPCILSPEFTEGWRSRQEWVKGDGKPDFEHLLKHFGDFVVPVANCDVKEYNANPKHNIPLRDYLNYWGEHRESGYSSPQGCLYMKDWHMHRVFPDHGVYSTPLFFQSDWLNEYWDSIQLDDYRFVYMGPKGSWTPFHADVFRSYSWSANICGRKKWLLFPPGEEEHLKNHSGNLIYDVQSPVLQDKNRYPKYSQCCQPIEVVQDAGEVIFVPSSWHHQVYNLEDTISINHNWLNGCNIDIMWQFLQQELMAVQEEIREWKDHMEGWNQHCQLLLKSCTGINYHEFYTFLKIIAKNRIAVLEATSGDSAAFHRTYPAELSTLGVCHSVFDLHQTEDVLTSMLTNENFSMLDSDLLDPRPEDLLDEIKEIKDAVSS
ncbi:2-oxoglutarate and iron-dependent oxygenase JMJD4 [Chiloscyllium plagiosum]|uniref:2-oxoglutarate and iron-dependent oxygenase JMJD4 n=1 Tax=Chiloscyllium plagiosum TaxID=36176 RepID=UPI001CB7DAA3|nr:2-oxoglutarate and iron-dependent oxygenase JMJD4 [Chiloscyllium plagiosum]